MQKKLKKSIVKWLVLVVLGCSAYLLGYFYSQYQEKESLLDETQRSSR